MTTEKDLFDMPDGAYDYDDIGVLTLDNISIDIDKLPSLPPRKIPEFSQAESSYTALSCTISNRYGQAMYLFNKEHDKKLWYQFLAEAEKNGRSPSGGWGVPNGINVVKNLWNKLFPEEKFVYVVLTKNEKEVKKLLDKGYPIAYTFRGNGPMLLEAQRDGVLDGTDWGTPTFGHTTNAVANVDYPNWKAIHKEIPYATSDDVWGKPGYKYPVYAMKNFLNFRGIYDNVYAMIPLKFADKQYADIIAKRKEDMLLLTKAEQDKIWNGLNINAVVLRYETVLMVMRKKGITGSDKEILEKAKEQGIFDGTRLYEPAKRYEVALMVSRALGVSEDKLWNKQRPDTYASRQETVLMIMRA